MTTFSSATLGVESKVWRWIRELGGGDGSSGRVEIKTPPGLRLIYPVWVCTMDTVLSQNLFITDC